MWSGACHPLSLAGFGHVLRIIQPCQGVPWHWFMSFMSASPTTICLGGFGFRGQCAIGFCGFYNQIIVVEVHGICHASYPLRVWVYVLVELPDNSGYGGFGPGSSVRGFLGWPDRSHIISLLGFGSVLLLSPTPPKRAVGVLRESPWWGLFHHIFVKVGFRVCLPPPLVLVRLWNACNPFTDLVLSTCSTNLGLKVGDAKKAVKIHREGWESGVSGSVLFGFGSLHS